MRIAIITGLFPPNGGGAEIVMERLARGLVSAGHTVEVFTTGRVAQRVERDGYVLHVLSGSLPWLGDLGKRSFISSLFWHAREYFDRSVIKDLQKKLIQMRVELVISGKSKGFGGPMNTMLQKLPAPHVHIVHDFSLLEPIMLEREDQMNRIQNKIWMSMSRSRFKKPDVVVFPSQWLQKLSSRNNLFKQSKQLVLINPISDFLDRTTAPDPNKGILRILFVGSLEPHKGALWATQILQKSKFKNWQLSIIGDGSQAESLQKLATTDSRIQLHGALSPVELESHWKKNDILIVPSLCLENNPLVILEALSHHIPVIAPKAGGIPEIINDDTGWLFSFGDTESFLRVFEEITDGDLWKKKSFSQLPPLRTPEPYARTLVSLITTFQDKDKPPLRCPDCNAEIVSDNCDGCGRVLKKDDVLDLRSSDLSVFQKAEADYHDDVTSDADDVHQLSSYRNRFYHNRILKHLRPVSPGGWVLELAGGSGVDGVLAVRNGVRLIESDISVGAVQHAQRQLSSIPDSNGRFVVAAIDAENLPVKNDSLSGVFMTASFHHAENPQKVLREACRVLAPGAAFVAAIEPHSLYFGLLQSVKPFFDRLLGARKKVSVADEEHSGFTNSELRKLFTEAGLEKIRIEPVWFLVGWLHYALEFLTRFLKRKKRLAVPEFVEKLLVAIDEIFFLLPGGYLLAWHWTISGRKPQA